MDDSIEATVSIDELLLGDHDGLAITWAACAELRPGDSGHVDVPWALPAVLAGGRVAPGTLTAHVIERQAALHGMRVIELVDQGDKLHVVLCVGADPRQQPPSVKAFFDREVAAGLEQPDVIARALVATPAQPICPSCTRNSDGSFTCLGTADRACGQHVAPAIAPSAAGEAASALPDQADQQDHA